MRKVIVILSFISFSFAANAGYWRCEGKKTVISFSHGQNGLVLSATKKGSEIPANLFRGQVSMDGIVFDSAGKALKDVSLVFANDYFKTREAGLNIKNGEFYIDDVATGKRIYTAIKLNCDYSEGE